MEVSAIHHRSLSYHTNNCPAVYATITGAYHTTPTTVLQSITGILPLYLRAEQEAVYVRVARLRRREYFLGQEISKPKTPSSDKILLNLILTIELIFRPPYTDSKGSNIYTDGSKMEGKAGSALVALQDNTQLHEWMAKLQPENSVLKAEILAIHEAIIWAIEQNVVCNI
ncbi:hypothetical protein AVEN_54305-1 [Araneus ventricosus]|uniref:Uncharacterized protein n=1 Tax=Araneus ventricosus TaxID=182803 RepID=A0A4Y1ZWF1_ARAVE|nr:hypothetical protein AVEN_54305-1 [Araneus ventricosus]